MTCVNQYPYADDSVFIKSFIDGLEQPPNLSLADWADEFRYLSPESSAEVGKYKATKYQRGIMDAYSSKEVSDIILLIASQSGKSEILNNIIGYHIHLDPGPILYVWPTKEMAESWSQDRLSPMLRDNPCLQGRVEDSRARDSGNQKLHKSFPGGHITGVGSNAPSALAGRPIRIALCDEVDRFPLSSGKEGDPCSLVTTRTLTFRNRAKRVFASTPTVEGESVITAMYVDSDQRRFHVPCPDCGASHPLEWVNVRWEKDTSGENTIHYPETALYYCPDCDFGMDDATRWSQAEKGEWIASQPFAGKAGFHMNALPSPFVELGNVVKQFLKSKGSPELMKHFINTVLAETWKENATAVSEGSLLAHREDYDTQSVPNDVLVITMGVDTQDNRLELEILGHGLNGHTWSIDYVTIPHAPDTAECWDTLDTIYGQKFKRKDGVELSIRSGCMDTGGHFASTVATACHKRASKRLYATFGLKGGKSLWPMQQSMNKETRKPIWGLGVNLGKDRAIRALSVEDANEPNYCHFPNNGKYTETYFSSLTAEEQRIKMVNGFVTKVWHKKKERNEAFDCRVYALAALDSQKLDLIKIKEILDREAEAISKGEALKPKPSLFRLPSALR